MSLPVILRPAADADIQDTHDELEQLQCGLGTRFIARLREILERIEAMPMLYGLVWQDVRAARLMKFQHVVYYVVFADKSIILKPPRQLTLELALEYIEDDELVEVTPKAIRLRKMYLKENDRKRFARQAQS